MTLEQLTGFIKEQTDYLRTKNSHISGDQEKWVYAQAVKVGEEVGELNDAILGHFSLQRDSKSDKPYDLEGELADVILATLILAEELAVDVLPAIDHKIAKIRARSQA